MAKVKNISGEDLEIPSMGGRLVVAGQVIEVDADAVYGLTCQPATWEPADAEAKKAHKAASEPADDNPEES